MNSNQIVKRVKRGTGGSLVSTIDKSHYTSRGEHPEDRIHHDREYIRRLQAHLDSVYDALEKDLGVKGESNWLFDFVYNEERDIEFEDYLRERGVLYRGIVQRTKRQAPRARKPAESGK
jgi:hypothetical protein